MGFGSIMTVSTQQFLNCDERLGIDEGITAWVFFWRSTVGNYLGGCLSCLDSQGSDLRRILHAALVSSIGPYVPNVQPLDLIVLQD